MNHVAQKLGITNKIRKQALLLAIILLFVPSIIFSDPISGNIDTNFGIDGQLNLTELLAQLPNPTNYVGANPVAILPMADGSQYVSFNVPDPARYSFIAKFTNDNVLDTSYGTNGISGSTIFGLNSMMMDGSGRLLISCDTGRDYNLIYRYVAGGIDNFPNGTGLFVAGGGKKTILQQSMGRYVINGLTTENYGALYAFNESGYTDTTFNANAENPGVFQFDTQTPINAVVADEYDRLIFATRNPNDSIIYITRLTSTGQVDITFGDNNSGSIATTITDATTDSIFITLDAAGNIVVINKIEATIACACYENTIGTTEVYSLLLDNSTVTANATITDLIATADGNILLSAWLSDEGDMWVARITSAGLLDTTGFNANLAYGNVAGFMQFSFDNAATVRNLNSIAIYPDGTISMVGTETDSLVVTAFMSRAYNTPDTTQESICLTSQPVGSNDTTLGIQTPPANAFFFAATVETAEFTNQYPQAIALQDDETIVVAIDGQVDRRGSSGIYLNVFGVDGLLDTSFNSTASSPLIPGQALVLNMFENQYVRDMMTFTTTDGVHKAILAGYASNSILNCNNSLLMQYNLDAASLDTDFGGFNGDSLGVAVGTGPSQSFVVGRQSTGRILLSGYDQSRGNGLVQAYTNIGKLDMSFGAAGYFYQGNSEIYVSVVDSQDRLLIAYYDAGNLVIARILSDGSGLDQTFGIDGTILIDYVTNEEELTSNNSFRIVLDEDDNIFVVSVLSTLEGLVIAVGQTDPDAQEVFVISSSFFSYDFGGTLTDFTIGKLLINQDGNLVIAGTDATTILITQVTIDEEVFIVLDQDFNTADTPGYLRYNISDDGSLEDQLILDGLVHPDGRYIFVGFKPRE
jgi:uncharacterized delta-60 repeat protein